MTLATTLACLLLLASPQPRGIVAAVLAQTQEPVPTQNPPEQSASPIEPTPDKSASAVPDTSKPAPATPKKKSKKPASRKPAKTTSVPSKDSPIVVIRNGGTLDAQGQISYSATDQQTLDKRKNTDALLNATATDLKQISGKQLNPTQQDMVKQIHNYMARSKDATTNGDVQGANNLAFKAHLLSQELVKP